MTFMDKLKSKAEELDLQGKADRLVDAAIRAAQQSREKIGELADENCDNVERVLDKAGAAIDERTEGKYADKVAKAKDTVAGSVDKLAEQRPGGPTPPGATPPGSPAGGGYASGAAAGGATAGTYTPEPYRPEPIDLPEPIDEPHAGTGWPQDQPPRP